MAIIHHRFYLIYTQTVCRRFLKVVIFNRMSMTQTFLSFTLSNMNQEKTKVLLVGTRQLVNQLEAPIDINFMGETLTPVTEVKDLGMFLNYHLTYDKHIQALS